MLIMCQEIILLVVSWYRSIVEGKCSNDWVLPEMNEFNPAPECNVSIGNKLSDY